MIVLFFSTSFVFVGFNIVSCWTGTLFWFAIGGSDAKVTSSAAVLVQIHKVTIERNLSNAWPILLYLLLFISGIITMVRTVKLHIRYCKSK